MTRLSSLKTHHISTRACNRQCEPEPPGTVLGDLNLFAQRLILRSRSRKRSENWALNRIILKNGAPDFFKNQVPQFKNSDLSLASCESQQLACAYVVTRYLSIWLKDMSPTLIYESHDVMWVWWDHNISKIIWNLILAVLCRTDQSASLMRFDPFSIRAIPSTTVITSVPSSVSCVQERFVGWVVGSPTVVCEPKYHIVVQHVDIVSVLMIIYPHLVKCNQEQPWLNETGKHELNRIHIYFCSAFLLLKFAISVRLSCYFHYCRNGFVWSS